jgi:hypothetical protein
VDQHRLVRLVGDRGRAPGPVRAATIEEEDVPDARRPAKNPAHPSSTAGQAVLPPVLTPARAEEAFGSTTAAFADHLCALVRHHGIEGLAVVILHQGMFRIVSTGTDLNAADRARQLAAQMAEALSKPPASALRSGKRG